ncbi:hypothetical protein SKAU_G00407990 [Synaphobranchus kaupii]|uniref:Uncharacterized protein n=1 Tax=Synaphobranchus kaupii TaxID=118154 RepID=A0A9Q1IC78_SYNKA|nr:hypothetical protein SKAU_G00407990 [Synaphobranchus kaupii]
MTGFRLGNCQRIHSSISARPPQEREFSSQPPARRRRTVRPPGAKMGDPLSAVIYGDAGTADETLSLRAVPHGYLRSRVLVPSPSAFLRPIPHGHSTHSWHSSGRPARMAPRIPSVAVERGTGRRTQRALLSSSAHLAALTQHAPTVYAPHLFSPSAR